MRAQRGFEIGTRQGKRRCILGPFLTCLATDLIISYLKLVRQKRKVSKFSTNVQRGQMRAQRSFETGTRQGKHRCVMGPFLTCLATDLILLYLKQVRQKRKISKYQLKSVARMNVGTARLRDRNQTGQKLVRIGTMLHLPRHRSEGGRRIPDDLTLIDGCPLLNI
jgi:hypothetical protein